MPRPHGLSLAYFAGYNAGIEAAAQKVEERGKSLQARAVDVERTAAAIRGNFK